MWLWEGHDHTKQPAVYKHPNGYRAGVHREVWDSGKEKLRRNVLPINPPHCKDITHCLPSFTEEFRRG